MSIIKHQYALTSDTNSKVNKMISSSIKQRVKGINKSTVFLFGKFLNMSSGNQNHNCLSNSFIRYRMFFCKALNPRDKPSSLFDSTRVMTVFGFHAYAYKPYGSLVYNTYIVFLESSLSMLSSTISQGKVWILCNPNDFKSVRRKLLGGSTMILLVY